LKTLDERLLELHIEESLKDGQSWCSHLNPCSNLLSLVCKRERFNRLLLTLHKSDEAGGGCDDDSGFYTVHVVNADGKQTELLKLPYEEDDFLTCVDNQVTHHGGATCQCDQTSLLQKNSPTHFFVEINA
jgi:hypothetical protein